MLALGRSVPKQTRVAKVCILLTHHWDSARGGAEYQAHLFADYLARTTSHEVTFLTCHLPPNPHGYSYAVEGTSAKANPRVGMFWDAIPLYRSLVELKPDLVIQRVASAHTGIAAIYCSRHNSKLLWHVSSDRDVSGEPELPVGRTAGYIDRVIFRYGVRHASAVVTQTDAQAAALIANYRRSATAIVSNFLPAPTGTLQKSRRFTVLWIANFKQLKRPELFLRLARELVGQEIDFKMAGRPDKSVWCDSLIREISNQTNIEYLGELHQDDVNTQLDGAHLLVNTSLYEGLPNVFIQAWMRGVLTTTLNVDPDGLIRKFNLGGCESDVERLKQKVLHYCANRDELYRLASNARRFAIERFSMKNAQALVDVVDELLQTKCSTAASR